MNEADKAVVDIFEKTIVVNDENIQTLTNMNLTLEELIQSPMVSSEQKAIYQKNIDTNKAEIKNMREINLFYLGSVLSMTGVSPYSEEGFKLMKKYMD